ncbi:MAG: hypothetical protein ACO1N0_12780 [Fluviicola sp.]
MKNLIAVIILSALSFGSYSQEEADNSMEKKFVLKFCPTQLIAGEFNFSYEQRVARIISLELEVGPTISQFGLNFGNQRLWRSDLWEFDAINPDADAAIGFHASLAPKFYPTSQDNELKGLYLSPMFKYRTYNYTVEDVTGNLDDQRASLSQAMFRFNMGFQFWPGDGNFSIDMYFGVGLSTFTIKDRLVDNYVDNQGYVQSQWVTNTDTGVRLNVATGLKFGFGM